MFSKHVLPSDYTFNTLVHNFAKERMVREAGVIIELMIDRRYDPDTVKYKYTIH